MTDKPVVSRVMIISSNMVPLSGYPTTGAGLRAWGLGQALITHGFDVTFAIPASSAKISKFKPRDNVLVFPDAGFGNFIKKHRPEAIIFQHWPWVNALPENEVPYTVIDLHGPLLLESLFRLGDQVRGMYHEKLLAFGKADYFTCAGERQRNYFYGWMLMAGADLRKVSIDVIPFSMGPDTPEHTYPDEPAFVYGGVFLPWQNPTLGLRVLTEELEARQTGHLTVYGGNHPWLHMPPQPAFIYVQELLSNSSYATVSPAIPRDELIQRYLHASVAWDLMAHNAERGMAFTSRTVEYLWAGLPVVYADYAELADYIRRYEAGWTVNPEDEAAIRAVVQEILDNPDEIVRRGKNAQRLVREELNWEQTIQPLVQFLREPARYQVEHFPFKLEPIQQLRQIYWQLVPLKWRLRFRAVRLLLLSPVILPWRFIRRLTGRKT
jgi:glycosyltransferase involved in cell wall biosynthesis